MSTNYAFLTVAFVDGTVDPLKFKDYPDYIPINATDPGSIIPQPDESIIKAQAYTRFKFAEAALTEIGGVIQSTVSDVLINGVGGLTVAAPGTGFANGIYLNEPVSGGSGTGLTIDVTVSGTIVTGITVNYSGTGYADTDTGLTLDNFAGASVDVTTIVGTASATPSNTSLLVGYQSADTLYEYVVAKLDNTWFSDTTNKELTVIEGTGWIIDQAMNGLADPRTLPGSASDAIEDFRYEIVIDDQSARVEDRHQYGTTTATIPSLITGQNVVVTVTDVPLVFNP